MSTRQNKRVLAEIDNLSISGNARKRRRRNHDNHNHNNIQYIDEQNEEKEDQENINPTKQDRKSTNSHGSTITLGYTEFLNVVKRVMIATLSQHGNVRTDATIRRIVDVSAPSVTRWKNADLTNPISLIDEPRSGRKPLKKNHFLQNIVETSFDPNFSRRGYANEHHNDEISISKSHVSRICVEQGLYAYKNKLVGKMSEENRAARLKWGLENQHHGVEHWMRHLFSDSKMWRLHAGMNRQNQRTTVPKGQIDRIRNFKKPKYAKAIHTYAGVAGRGLSQMVEVQGTVTAKKYVKEVLPVIALEAMWGRNRRSNRNSTNITKVVLFEDPEEAIFEQDHATAHTAKISQDWFIEKGIEVIPYDTPAKMDDIWCIERLWAILTPIVYRLPTPETLDELRERVFTAWEQILPGTCMVLVHEMPFRIRKMVEKNGEKLTHKLKEREKCPCDFCVNWRNIHKHNKVYSHIM